MYLDTEKPFRQIFGRFEGLFANKYFFAVCIFLVWITFFDKHSLITNHKLNDKLEALIDENESYLKMIELTKGEAQELNQNLEKFAREKYFFQKENEDVFVIVKE